jgi:nitrite reductase (NADH) large subunit
MTDYLIIGNGVAGATAAEKIRERDPRGGITVFSEETDPFYYRPRLPELVAGETPLERFTLHDRQWYADRDIELRLGQRIVEVDHPARRARDAGGGETEYRKLLLATGAHPFIPPVEGADKEGVFALRTAADARAIREAARGAETAVLVGGGLLGLEAGHGLVRRGIKVEVVEFFDRLLPRQMDPAGAAKLQGILEGMGFGFHLGAKAEEVLGPDRVTGLRLAGGAELACSVLLFSAGVRGNLELAEQMDLDVNNGLVVDDAMRTSAEEVWAAGDQVEHRGRLYGIWPASREQGETAGINMAGGEALYEGTVMSNSLKVVGVDLTSAGEVDPEGKHQAAVYQDEGVYRKIVLEQGRIKGFIFLGLTHGVREAARAMDRGAQVGHLAKEMERPDFDFSRLPA